MNTEDRQHLKAALVQAGLWPDDEQEDPTCEWPATHALTERMQELLASEACLDLIVPLTREDGFTLMVIWRKSEYVIATGSNFYEVVCRGALVLRHFLHEHPECAAVAPVRRYVSETQLIEAKLAELMAIRDVVAEKLLAIETTLAEATKMRDALQFLAKPRAYQAFTGAGGSDGDFEHLWPETFEEAFQTRRELNRQPETSL